MIDNDDDDDDDDDDMIIIAVFLGCVIWLARVIRSLQSIQKTLLVLVKIFLAKNFNSES